MGNRLTEVVDKAVSGRENIELNLCPWGSDVVDETRPLGGDDTCGGRMLSTKGEPGGLGDSFIETLEFTHFVTRGELE